MLLIPARCAPKAQVPVTINPLADELNGENAPAPADYSLISVPALPSVSYASVSDFDDISDNITRDNLLNAIEVIEANIHGDDGCKLVYVEWKIGEYFDCLSSTIERNNTVTSQVDCIAKMNGGEVSS